MSVIETRTASPPAPRRRVILSMGGKGGVGKTNVMTGLAEWYEDNEIPVTLLDLDTENKARGSLAHFFNGRAPKINVHTPEGLDAFLDYLDAGPPIVLADMGSGAGRVTHTWFDEMYAPVARLGIVFTAVGVITADPASVESVLTWADRLQRRVSYLIVENETDANATFTYWRDSAQARAFQQAFAPAVIQMAYRLPHLETAMRIMGSRSQRSFTVRRQRRSCSCRKRSCARKGTERDCSSSSKPSKSCSYRKVIVSCATMRINRPRSVRDETMFGVRQDGEHLLTCDTRKPGQEVVDARAFLEIFEERANGNARACEHPGATHALRDIFHRRTIVPGQHHLSIGALVAVGKNGMPSFVVARTAERSRP